jgi:mycothione reductase
VLNIVHPHAQRPVHYQAIPHAIFASPQVASVGVTEREARAKHLPYLVGKKDYSATAYGWAIEDTESFVKILGHRETREILGAHILGPHAAILLQPLINAMRFRETIDQLARDTVYIHPALTEVIENALLEM